MRESTGGGRIARGRGHGPQISRLPGPRPCSPCLSQTGHFFAICAWYAGLHGMDRNRRDIRGGRVSILMSLLGSFADAIGCGNKAGFVAVPGERGHTLQLS